MQLRGVAEQAQSHRTSIWEGKSTSRLQPEELEFKLEVHGAGRRVMQV